MLAIGCGTPIAGAAVLDVARTAVIVDITARCNERRSSVRLDRLIKLVRSGEIAISRAADAAWSYRVGPPAQDLIVLSLEQRTASGEMNLLSQACRFFGPRPGPPEPTRRLGLSASVRADGQDAGLVTVEASRFLHGVRSTIPDFTPEDDAFFVEPGQPRRVRLRRAGKEKASPRAAYDR